MCVRVCLNLGMTAILLEFGKGKFVMNPDVKYCMHAMCSSESK